MVAGMLPIWATCQACGHAVPDLDNKLVYIEMPAPCCGAKGMRAMWPNAALAPLEHALSLDLSSDAGERTACIFLAASLEAILAETLWHLLSCLTTSGILAQALMANVDGRRKLLETYKRLTGQSAKVVLEAHGLKTWYQAWEDLASARNGLAHGTWHVPLHTKSIGELVAEVSQDALTAMARLRNAGIDKLK